MRDLDLAAIERALDRLPQSHPGPGGVAGLVKDGEVIARRAWGYADLAARRPMTATLRLPICSISKQFTCAVLLDAIGDPARLDARIADFLPQFQGPLPTARQLADNQSGLRDYWALTVLQGAQPEQTFARSDALPLIARMKTGHFPPGSGYSYCNANFRILGELIEAETGVGLDALYAGTVFGPAGMETAMLAPNTRQRPDGVIGYEGSEQAGHVPADNGIYWIGDAGIAATLDDMLAYERWIDATRDDAAALYGRLAAPASFSDGAPARYGMGLGRATVAGTPVTGHGGALRGFRAHRLHAADHRLSVVVMFNHEADAQSAANGLLAAALGWAEPAAAPVAAGWDGQWLDPATGLIARIATDAGGANLRFATTADRLTADGAALRGPAVRLEQVAGAVRMQRLGDNLTTLLDPLPPVEMADGAALAGRYRSDELEAGMSIEVRDGAVFAGFDGMLGEGPMERLHPAGADVWTLASRRSMDAPAPGDWTLRLARDGAGAVSGLTLGCWLARGIDYRRS